MACEEASTALMVAGIDFGTTYTGFGYSTRASYQNESERHRVWTKNWTCSGGGPALVSEKTPTVLLLDQDKNFHSFGYDAEDHYNQLAQEDKHIGWYYFNQFKMTLYHEKISRETMLKTDQELELPALEVFKHAILFIKNQLLKELANRNLNNEGIKSGEILWVLTVPAIWDYKAKQFMKEAANRAGIPSNQLMLALEPEAASVFVKNINVSIDRGSDEGPSLSAYNPGTRYMVLDLGGGTVDVTVREVMPDRTLKEVTKASGGAWGGMYVNEEINKFLEEIFTEKVMSDFRKSSTADYLDLQRGIEMMKRKLQADKKGFLTLSIPMDLRERFEKANGRPIQEALPSSSHSHQCQMKRDKLKFPQEQIAQFFSPCIESIITHCKEVLRKAESCKVNDIIMVGGFAESNIMQILVKKAFPDKSIVIPEEAGLIVLKGAVLYGHHPRIVSRRKARKTIGFRTLRYFIKGVDPDDKLTMEEGEPYCKDIFIKLCESGEEFMLGQKVDHVVEPLRPNQTEMKLNIYQTDEKDPTYTTDVGCEEIGQMTVEMLDTTKGMDRNVIVSLYFGDTDIIVSGMDGETERVTNVHLDLLLK